MKILIYEHFSAGGFGEQNIPPSVLSEGYGILRTATADAKRAGHDVTTILDKQIASYNDPLDADRIITIPSLVDAEHSLFETAENCEATYIMAPSSRHKLQHLVERMQNNYALSLNCNANSITRASDKSWLIRQVNKLGLKAPKSVTLTVRNNENELVEAIREETGFPAVLKLPESDGCEGINIVRNEKQAKAAIVNFASRKIGTFIAQELIQGIAASVSLISNGIEAQPIALNKQDISLKTPSQNSSYNGGLTPYRHKQIRAAFAAAKSLVESVEGLKGYVGVDMVLTANEPVIMEINPRLTTSYVGIKEILHTNIMQTIVNSILNRKVPEPQRTTGFAYFGKIKISNPTLAGLRHTFDMPEVISPPFPVYDNSRTFAFVCEKGSTMGEARQKFNRKKKQLQNIVAEG